MSKSYYPSQCKEYGHNHLDHSIYIDGIPQSFHITCCMNYGGIWPFRKRCEHIEEWTPDLKGTPPLSIFKTPSPASPSNSHYTPMHIPPPSQPEDIEFPQRIKKGDTVYITLPGIGYKTKPMHVVNVTKKGEADELELEEV
jgi:hypothetical protein